MSSPNKLSGFANVCRYCRKSFRLKIELVYHKRKDHQDEVRQVKPKSNQDFIEFSQLKSLKTMQNKRKAEEKLAKVKKSTVASKPADGQQEVKEEEKEMEFQEDQQFIIENDTTFYEDETEIDIQEEEFFQCSSCGSNFLTADILRSHEPECDNEIQNRHKSHSEAANSYSDLFNYEQVTKVQTITLLKQCSSGSKSRQQKRLFFKHTEEAERKKSKKVQGESVQPQLSFERPKLSFTCLVALAIKNSPTQSVVCHEVYKFVAKVFPFYQNCEMNSWKNSLRHTLTLKTFFKKSEIITFGGVTGTKFVYSLHSDAKSQLRMENIIRYQVRNNEEAIKSCMRCPEDFSSLIYSDLRSIAEEDGGDDREEDEEGGDDDYDDEEPTATFQDFEFSSDPLQTAASELELPVINLHIQTASTKKKTFTLQSPVPIRPKPQAQTFVPVQPQGMPHRPAILRKSTKAL